MSSSSLAELLAFVRRVADFSNDGWLAREAQGLLDENPQSADAMNQVRLPKDRRPTA